MGGVEMGRGLFAAMIVMMLSLVIFSNPANAAVHDEPATASISSSGSESVLRIGLSERIDSLNPLIGTRESSELFMSLVYDSLHSIGNDLESVGNLATSTWIVPETDLAMASSGEPYGSVWQYNLTTNAEWSDGEPFTADDVVFTINLLAQYYDLMWMDQPYTYFISHAERIDARTVRIHFYDRETGTPIPVSFGYQLPIYILPKHALSTMNPSEIAFVWNGVFSGTLNPMICTGPFIPTDSVYSDWLSGSSITLMKNPNYHWTIDKSLMTSIDQIELCFYDSVDELSIAIQEGEVDVGKLWQNGYQSIVELVDSHTLADVEPYAGLNPENHFTELAFNMNTAGPNQARLDPAVREALAMATDKQTIVDQYYLGYADVGSTLISPVNEQWHYEPTADELFDFDLAAAAQMLEDAGYRYPSEGADYRVATVDSLAVQEGWVIPDTRLAFEMLIRIEFPEEELIAKFLTDQWKLVGVELVPDYMTEAQLATHVYAYSYDTMIWYWNADPEPNHMLFCQANTSISGWNDNAYDRLSYNEAYMTSVMAMDEDDRKVQTDECQRINYLDAAYIILAYPYQTVAWRTDTFTGWGDWDDDPGRNLFTHWTGNPLLFDLKPVTDTINERSAEEVGLDDGDLSDRWFSTSVFVNLTCCDEFGEIIEVEYSIDASTWYDYTSVIIFEDEGSYVLEYCIGGYDEDAIETMTINIDKTDPILTLEGESDFAATSDKVRFSWICSDALSGMGHIETCLDGGGFVDQGDVSSVEFTGLEDGRHHLYIVAYDEANNSRLVHATFVVETGLLDPDGPIGIWGIFGLTVVATAACIAAGLVVLRLIRKN